VNSEGGFETDAAQPGTDDIGESSSLGDTAELSSSSEDEADGDADLLLSDSDPPSDGGESDSESDSVDATALQQGKLEIFVRGTWHCYWFTLFSDSRLAYYASSSRKVSMMILWLWRL